MINFSIKISEKIFHFKSDTPRISYEPSNEREFKGFLYQGPKKADVIFDIRYGKVPDFSEKETLFHVDKSWTLSRYKDKILFEYPDRSLPGRIERVAEIDKDMKEGIIYVNRDKTPEEEEESRRLRTLQMTEEERRKQEERRRNKGEIMENKENIRENKESTKSKKKEKTPEKLGRKVMSEIKANFFQAFLVEYLVRQKVGFLVHCSSVQSDNKLYLFMGQSRAGKSTIAGFWHDRVGAAVFNDDRAIITVRDGAPYFYNTPWVGTFMEKCSLGSGDMTKIDKIFFLYHNGYNELKRINRVEAAAKIFRNSFPVFWERGALHYILDMCSETAGALPCYDLGFVNGDSVVGFLKKELHAGEKKVPRPAFGGTRDDFSDEKSEVRK